jgi:hypothetical protein
MPKPFRAQTGIDESRPRIITSYPQLARRSGAIHEFPLYRFCRIARLKGQWFRLPCIVAVFCSVAPHAFSSGFLNWRYSEPQLATPPPLRGGPLGKQVGFSQTKHAYGRFDEYINVLTYTGVDSMLCKHTLTKTIMPKSFHVN